MYIYCIFHIICTRFKIEPYLANIYLFTPTMDFGENSAFEFQAAMYERCTPF